MSASKVAWARLHDATVAMMAAAALTAAAPAHKTHTIYIDDMTFGPMPASLRVGDTVRWVNRDMFRHTATARDKSFDVDLPPNATADTKIGRAGTIQVYCRFHPGMKAVLKVAG